MPTRMTKQRRLTQLRAAVHSMVRRCKLKTQQRKLKHKLNVGHFGAEEKLRRALTLAWSVVRVFLAVR
jgi:hypothetical protein